MEGGQGLPSEGSLTMTIEYWHYKLREDGPDFYAATIVRDGGKSWYLTVCMN